MYSWQTEWNTQIDISILYKLRKNQKKIYVISQQRLANWRKQNKCEITEIVFSDYVMQKLYKFIAVWG